MYSFGFGTDFLATWRLFPVYPRRNPFQLQVPLSQIVIVSKVLFHNKKQNLYELCTGIIKPAKSPINSVLPPDKILYHIGQPRAKFKRLELCSLHVYYCSV